MSQVLYLGEISKFFEGPNLIYGRDQKFFQIPSPTYSRGLEIFTQGIKGHFLLVTLPTTSHYIHPQPFHFLSQILQLLYLTHFITLFVILLSK